MVNSTSRGKIIWDKLRHSLRTFQLGPVSAGRSREVIWGVTARGTFVGGLTLDEFLARAGKVLRDSGRVYRWKDTLCLEAGDAEERRLLVLASQQKAEPCAAWHLSNLFCVGVQGEGNSSQSLVPPSLVGALLADHALWRQLPAICSYSRRPVFDDNFNLCAPGWNPRAGVLVHGAAIEPCVDAVPYAPDAPALDRLPPLLRRLFGGFCWASDADLTNAVGMLLTGFLANHFVKEGKPVGIIDGNQKGVGKTVLVQALGRVLDDAEPPRIPLVRDEELEKKLCALLREARSSIVFFDNVRERVESGLIEANALSPVLSFRILGQSGNLTRPNELLWLITSNQASGTEDLISRGLPIRLRYEGNPRERTFGENLLDLVSKRRQEILGEVAGMVVRWRQAGAPQGARKHRCVHWAQVIGGILQTAGLTDFLANVDEAEAAMDEGLVALTSLAEHVLERNQHGYFAHAGADSDGTGKSAGDWVQVFADAEVCRDQLANKNPKGKATWVGTFLGAKVERQLSITTARGAGTATLRARGERSRRRLYLFEVALEADDTDAAPPAVASGAGSLADNRRRDGGRGGRLAPRDAGRASTLHPAPKAVEPQPEAAPVAVAGRGEAAVGDDLDWT